MGGITGGDKKMIVGMRLHHTILAPFFKALGFLLTRPRNGMIIDKMIRSLNKKSIVIYFLVN